jgi:hypothetical protein
VSGGFGLRHFPEAGSSLHDGNVQDFDGASGGGGAAFQTKLLENMFRQLIKRDS